MTLLQPTTTHANEQLDTPWTADVDKNNPLPEYPRPQMRRSDWTNLNGQWDYAVKHHLDNKPTEWGGSITVPFPIESHLSGVKRHPTELEAIWYQRKINLHKPMDDQRILIHFGAIDWHAKIYVNDQYIGEHRGGFVPFSFDITHALNNTSAQTITIRVYDPTNSDSQARGKQIHKPHGIFYTSASGIWQTVWLEKVPQEYIQSIKIIPDLDNQSISVNVRTNKQNSKLKAILVTKYNNQSYTSALNTPFEIPANDCQLWSPESPNLYDFEVMLIDGNQTVDSISSYFALRKISFTKDKTGYNRLHLNNKPIFQFGPLDQGYWPDGIYTAPTDEALRYDIEVMKKMGFNMVRKHVKIESARWYYWADKLGIMVWQDFPNSGATGEANNHHAHQNTTDGKDVDFNAIEHTRFMEEWKAAIDAYYNHPSIVVWIPFNEGWGQHKTNDVIQWTMNYDPSRLTDAPSGWFDRGLGDMIDKHSYPDPGMFPALDHRVSVLGEFGGLLLNIKGHLWQGKTWGYKETKSQDDLLYQYEDLIQQLPPLIARGLAAAVYTQLTDVEIEANGLITYDRKVIKIDPQTLTQIHATLFKTPPAINQLLPTSDLTPQTWQYTTRLPKPSWMNPDYDDSLWQSSEGGFGTPETPNTNVGTKWNSQSIWLRKEFNLNTEDIQNAGSLRLKIYHDEDAEVYINGILAAEFKGFTTSYRTARLKREALDSLKPGLNIIAVTCQQTKGGQFIDVGLEQYQQ
ncbi:Beta-galactosidase [Poriferisphaera corsica]|uniref:Beta-galactosidase n=1 Tax=Poriferisphaera corsica TaxID=2528020 RepID=A0A517YRJ4_9BACT|nr:sugar-binding domain-containing protein [Poriferisphaera corsica]QDU32845.1 Beta-galactosidase [Poriferisphaera corsica]